MPRTSRIPSPQVKHLEVSISDVIVRLQINRRTTFVQGVPGVGGELRLPPLDVCLLRTGSIPVGHVDDVTACTEERQITTDVIGEVRQ